MVKERSPAETGALVPKTETKSTQTSENVKCLCSEFFMILPIVANVQVGPEVPFIIPAAGEGAAIEKDHVP